MHEDDAKMLEVLVQPA
jgi:hypothetical protein